MRIYVLAHSWRIAKVIAEVHWKKLSKSKEREEKLTAFLHQNIPANRKFSYIAYTVHLDETGNAKIVDRCESMLRRIEEGKKQWKRK